MPKQKCAQKFSTSKTIPGQSLYPADLMKRHLAGTLPPIDLSSKYEYHYDEQGNQLAEPLPLEMHKLHELAVALRNKQYEAAVEARKAKALKDRDLIIEEFKKQQEELKRNAAAPPVTTKSTIKKKPG